MAKKQKCVDCVHQKVCNMWIVHSNQLVDHFNVLNRMINRDNTIEVSHISFPMEQKDEFEELCPHYSKAKL